MMTSGDTLTAAVGWLLDLQHIRVGRDSPLSVEWHPLLPPWALFALGMLAGGAVAAIYVRETGRAGRRIVLGGLRVGVIGVVLAMVARPVLRLQQNRLEPAEVVLLVDASRSMAFTDVYDAAAASSLARAAEVTEPELPDHARFDLLRRVLAANDGAALAALLANNALSVYTFSSTASALASADDPAEATAVAERLAGLEPTGVSTSLAAAITAVLERRTEARTAAIVVASDGRSTSGGTLAECADLVASRQVPIYAVPIGSPTPPTDVAVSGVRTEDSVFKDDLLVVRARVTGAGLAGPTPVLVELVDERRGAVVASQQVELAPPPASASGPLLTEQGHTVSSSVEVELHAQPTRVGKARYTVRASALPGERNVDNNADAAEVQIVDNRLSVLYVEGYPRFEYRYLKNALLREDTIRLSVLLLSADEKFVQEGTDPIRRFPETMNELEQYDVVLLGDVDPAGEWLRPDQAEMLVEFVSQRGGGFGLIAGERFAPHAFRGTVLQKLLPIRIDPQFLGTYTHSITTAFHAELTAEGRRSRLFRWRRRVAANSEEMIESLPGLYWIAQTLGPAPGAEALAVHPTLRTPTGPMPVLTVGYYGAGRTLFQASDDTWRWRRAGGELTSDAYWVQVVRELAPPSRGRGARRVTIRSDLREPPYGQPVALRVEVFDSELLADIEREPTVTIFDEDGAPAASAPLLQLAAGSRLFEATFTPPRPGRYAAKIDVAAASSTGIDAASASIHVAEPDLEARDPTADLAALARLAEQTGGQVIPPDRLVEAFSTIPDRGVRIPDDIREPLWDSKLALGLFVLMITMEWVTRKASGML